MDMFVIGYPFGKSGGGYLPIWKHATIASEPNVAIDDLPKMYADTASRPGMSGSPVLVVTRAPYASSDGKFTTLDFGKKPTVRFVGVYSGRVGIADDLDTQLGVVWQLQALEEIAVNHVLGENPYPPH